MNPKVSKKENEREQLLANGQASATTETMYQLVQEFLRLVRSLQVTQLNSWLSTVAASDIPECFR